MTTITQDGQPVTEQDRDHCQFEFSTRDFDGGTAVYPCGAPVTHRPIMDDAYSAHLRATGVTEEQVHPHELPLCDDHYEQLLVDIAGQADDDPYRVWIAAEPTKIVVGWTISDRDHGYVSYMDGWRAGQPQHELSIEVAVPPSLAPHQVADLVFIATNAPDVESHPYAAKILEAIVATGYRGEEAGHFSLSVGDTVTVDGIKLACQASNWVNAE